MSIISGISVICFAASYSLVLALEVIRFSLRRAVPLVLVRGFAAAGLLAHTLYLIYRARVGTSTPLSSAFEWILLGAWGLAAVYLYLTFTHSKAALGLFLLPIILALIGLATFADDKPFPQSRADKYGARSTARSYCLDSWQRRSDSSRG